MNRKQSQQPIGSYMQSNQQRNHYHQTSPYIELLQSKKSVYGHRYDTKNIRSYTNYVKPSPASITSIFNQKVKPFKSASNQKGKAQSFTNDKKKRTRTEQAQQKMHESMCIYPTISDKNNQQHASKSLYYVEQKLTNTQFQPNSYFQQLTEQKNKRKRHLSQNKHSYSQQVSNQSNQNNNNYLKANLLQNLQITDIDSLINLIDNCTNQANEYICYLSQKMAAIKQQLLTQKARINQLQQEINRKNLQISQKDDQIKRISKKMSEGKQYKKQHGFQVKNLLQIIQKLSEQNQRLRLQLQQGKYSKEKKIDHSGKIYEKQREKQKQKQKQRQRQKQKQVEIQKQKDPRRDYYNQIHSKIDILNISIDNNNNFLQNSSPSETKQKQEKLDRDISKKYKFIKAKGR